MIYTLDKIRTYTRSIDERLEDTDKYTNTWIDERIEEGMAIAQDIKAIFYQKEKYDLETNFKPVADGGDGLTEVEIIPLKEVHSIWAVECDLQYFEVLPTANNHVVIKAIPDAPLPTDWTVTIRYFFYPTMPFVEIEMSMEMYKLVKRGIAIACYDWLKDRESEQYHQAIAESLVIKSTFDTEKDLLSVPPERLWSSSWV